MRQRLLGVSTWAGALLLGTVLFHALGDGALAPPPLEPAAWGPWLEGRDPLIASMALLRLVVLGLCWYLVGVTTIGIVARLLRAARLVRLADALTLPIVRRLLEQTLGVALATTMVTAGAGSGTVVAAPVAAPAQVSAAASVDGVPGGEEVGPARTDAVTLPPLPSLPRPGAPDALAARSPADGAPGVTLRGLPGSGDAERLPLPWRIAEAGGAPGPADDVEGASDGAQGASGRAPGPPDDAPRPAVTPRGASDPADPAPERAREVDASHRDDGTPRGSGVSHTVRAGESLWRIANAQLEDALGRSVTDAEIVPYWRALIAVNRERLPDRDDPDLILPGQELLLPPMVSP